MERGKYKGLGTSEDVVLPQYVNIKTYLLLIHNFNIIPIILHETTQICILNFP